MDEFILQIEHLRNARSLSYLVNKEGKRIKPNLLIRSGNLAFLEEEDCLELANKYHITKVIDFRTKKEALEKPDKAIPGAEYIFIPVILSEAYGVTRKNSDEETFDDFIERLQGEGIEKSNNFMKDTYTSIVCHDYAMTCYRKFIDELISAEGPVLWHCSAGKDRAGLATMMILSILDFKWEDIVNDYMLTNKFTQPIIDALSIKYGEDHREILECVFGVKSIYVDYIIDAIQKEHSSFADFVVDKLKIDAATKQLLKDKYLEVK